MNKAACAIGLVLAAILIAGCSPSPGSIMLAYERNDINVSKLTTVATDGLYVLFPGEGENPLEAVTLNKGDQFGFQMREGKAAGVYIKAGQAHYVSLESILSINYVWKYQGDKQP